MNNPQLTEMLEAERVELEQELAKVRQKITDSERRQASILSQLRHVRGLLGLTGAGASALADAEGAEDNYRNSRSRDVCDIAAAILAERNKEPMYYKDLAVEVQNRGGIMGGATPEATLVSKMTSDNRFLRPQRKGYYALREDYPYAPNVGARRRND